MNDEERDQKLEELEKMLKDGQKWRFYHGTFKALLWFAMPFGAMWGAGIPVEDAARFAVLPFACVGITVAIGGFALMAVGRFYLALGTKP